MRRLLTAFVILVCTVSALSAQIMEFSAGGGLLYDFSMGNGTKEEVSTHIEKNGFNYNYPGVFAFFDATYIEANIYFAFGFGQSYLKIDDMKIGQSDKRTTTQVGLNVLGKFPFFIDKITVFPLIGASYNLVFYVKDEVKGKQNNPIDWSQIGILGGAGIDYDLKNNLFIRIEALFQMRFASNASQSNGTKNTLGIGPVIKAGIGFRL